MSLGKRTGTLPVRTGTVHVHNVVTKRVLCMQTTVVPSFEGESTKIEVAKIRIWSVFGL